MPISRMRTMLRAVLVGLIMVMCQPSMAASTEPGYLSAPDTILAVLQDQRHDTAEVLGASPERTCGSQIGEGAGVITADKVTINSASESPGGATACGDLRQISAHSHPGQHERLRPG